MKTILARSLVLAAPAVLAASTPEAVVPAPVEGARPPAGVPESGLPLLTGETGPSTPSAFEPGEGSSLLGIAGEDGGVGESVPVILGGVSDAQSGLIPWIDYYAGSGGTLEKENPWGPKVGRSLSATEILLTIH